MNDLKKKISADCTAPIPPKFATDKIYAIREVCSQKNGIFTDRKSGITPRRNGVVTVHHPKIRYTVLVAALELLGANNVWTLVTTAFNNAS